MKKLIIGLIFISFSLLIYFVVTTKDSGDSDTAKLYARVFAKSYLISTYGSVPITLVWNLDKWSFEKKHYRLEINLKWDGKEVDASPCELEQDLLVTINHEGKLYDYSIIGQNACSKRDEMIGTLGRASQAVLEIGLKVQQMLNDPNEN